MPVNENKSRLLKANKIINNPEDTYENKLAVLAINKINELYNRVD